MLILMESLLLYLIGEYYSISSENITLSHRRIPASFPSLDDGN